MRRGELVSAVSHFRLCPNSAVQPRSLPALGAPLVVGEHLHSMVRATAAPSLPPRW